MKTFSERAAEALDLLPEEMREPAVAYLLEQAEKFRYLKKEIESGDVVITQGAGNIWQVGQELLKCLRTK